MRTGDLVFDWDETFELDLVANKELDFLIYSWDPQYRHKLCYKVRKRCNRVSVGIFFDRGNGNFIITSMIWFSLLGMLSGFCKNSLIMPDIMILVPTSPMRSYEDRQ